MIKTNHKVVLEIDNNAYSVVISEPSKKQIKELKDSTLGKAKLYEKRDSLQRKLNEKEEEYSINKSILQVSSLVDKLSVWLEQKTLNKEISKFKEDLFEQDKDLQSIGDAHEEILGKRFDTLVSCDKQEGLKEEIEEKGISYQVIFSALGELIKESQKKSK